MPVLYLAKVNLNSSIFDVYKSELELESILDEIVINLKDGITYYDEKSEIYTDAYGGKQKYVKKSHYSLRQVRKSDLGTVTGVIIRRINKPTEEIDEKTNQLKTTYVEVKISIAFYYDVYKEYVTFCERQSFGYNQFMTAFTNIIEQAAGLHKFELFLEKDKDVLAEKLAYLKVVKNVRATLIPPNPNEDDLAELRNELLYMQQCEEANATRVKMEYISESLKMDSKVMKEIISAVSRGYGDLTATGMNRSGHQQTISSNQDAAFTSDIEDSINEAEFIEESQNLISRFLSKMSKKG